MIRTRYPGLHAVREPESTAEYYDRIRAAGTASRVSPSPATPPPTPDFPPYVAPPGAPPPTPELPPDYYSPPLYEARAATPTPRTPAPAPPTAFEIHCNYVLATNNDERVARAISRALHAEMAELGHHHSRYTVDPIPMDAATRAELQVAVTAAVLRDLAPHRSDGDTAVQLGSALVVKPSACPITEGYAPIPY